MKRKLRENADPKRAVNFKKFFKNSKEDIFLGVPTNTIRKIAKEYYTITLSNVLQLMKSTTHDERNIAHAILCLKFKKGDETEKKKIFTFYLKNKNTIRDWDSVDDTAPYIVGPYLLDKDKKILYTLAKSKRIWDRRIAIVSTWWFIRNNQIKDTLNIAKILLKDEEDLIQKATGWMLREVGKRDVKSLKRFLQQYHETMPRVTLRYAIERFPNSERKRYLINQRGKKS